MDLVWRLHSRIGNCGGELTSRTGLVQLSPSLRFKFFVGGGMLASRPVVLPVQFTGARPAAESLLSAGYFCHSENGKNSG